MKYLMGGGGGGGQGVQFGLFIKTKLYKLEGNKSLVKE